MQQPLSYRHRVITDEDLVFIRKLIADHPDSSRRNLSERLCEAWNWVQANGALPGLMRLTQVMAVTRLPSGSVATVFTANSDREFTPSRRHPGLRKSIVSDTGADARMSKVVPVTFVTSSSLPSISSARGLGVDVIGEQVGLQVDLDDAAEMRVAHLMEEARLGAAVGELSPAPDLTS